MAEEKRRILAKDFDEIESFINDEMESRERNAFRKDIVPIWKEVDRQIRMKAPDRVSLDGKPLAATWHNVFELGELAKASEIITADVMRMSFPEVPWFEPHVMVPGTIDPQTGMEQVQADLQESEDDRLRALMMQQHLDFGLKPRFELSVKESLHHGSFCAEVRYDKQILSREGKVKEVGSPVWVPYSMWNTFPDPSPSVIGTNLFYSGSMILVEYMPLYKLKKIAKGDGWIKNRLDKVQEKNTWKLESAEDAETDDVKLVKYFGDLHISRKKDDGIFIPNCKAICANGKLVFIQPNDDLPYLPIIFAGYERMDVRSPYYTSPIVKNSPMQKFTTIMMNRFADVADLWGDPPIEYDSNDPDYVANGGPRIAPGAKTPTRSVGKGMTALKVGDPTPLLQAGQFGVRMLEQGTGVSALRQGTASNERQTATEIRHLEQGAEVRTVDFVTKLGPSALRPFLYMQHELNRRKLSDYPAYVNEMNSADYHIFTRDEIDKDAAFDVVGARSMIGEERRKQQITQLTLAAAGSPIFAPNIAPKSGRILMDLFRDAGKKNPEEYVVEGGPQIPPQVQEQMQKMQQALQQLSQENQALKNDQQTERMKLQADHQHAMQKLQQEERFKRLEHQLDTREVNIKAAALQADTMLRQLELRFEAIQAAVGNQMEVVKTSLDERGKEIDRAVQKAEKKPEIVKPKRKRTFQHDERGNVIRIFDIDDPDFVAPEGAAIVPPVNKVIQYDDDDNIIAMEDL